MAIFLDENFIGKNEAPFLISSLRPEHSFEFARFLTQVYRETNFILNLQKEEFRPELLAPILQESLLSPHWVYLAAFYKEKIVGAIHVKVSLPEHPHYAHTAQMTGMSLKEFWGAGLAPKMVEMSENYMQKKGVHRIECFVQQRNSRMARLLEKLDYQLEGVKRQSLLVNGEFLNEVIFAKILEPK